MKKKNQKRKKVEPLENFNNIKDVFIDEEKPLYKRDEIDYIVDRFEQYAEAERLFPEFFGDKKGEFIIVD
jgi:succinate dehydrogenase/fumarate reductase-like Fe-S protein